MESLQARAGQWKLKAWPAATSVRSAVRTGWANWAQQRRFHHRVRRAMRPQLIGKMTEFCMPPWPPACREQARVFFSSSLLPAIALDPNFKLRSDRSASQVPLLAVARARAALPEWLRGCPRSQAVPLAPPAPLSFVTLKCFTREGLKTCSKQGHSCLRRLSNMSGKPSASAWIAIARAVRA
eukprot:9168864-Pyramimonas_sp.AAC.1